MGEGSGEEELVQGGDGHQWVAGHGHRAWMCPTPAFIPPVMITSKAAPGLLWGF